jgi:GGDEF domain-containing protein
VIDLLMQAIALHAVEGAQPDYDRFRAEIDRLQRSLGPSAGAADLHGMACGVVKALEEYNRLTSKFVRQQSIELQHMVSMLTRTLIHIGVSGDASTAKLQSIEKGLEAARMTEDMHMLKMRLGECLEEVRREALRQKEEGRSTLEALQKEVAGSQQRIAEHSLAADIDPATGLPGKSEAERAIQHASSSAGKMLAVVVINRVQAVYARFGYSVGDQMLAVTAQHFRKNLSARDRLYRWHGPTFIVLLDRDERIDHVRAEFRHFADTKLEKTVEIGSRTVLIPISANWSIFPIAAPAETLMKRVETFTAAQVPKDYV